MITKQELLEIKDVMEDMGVMLSSAIDRAEMRSEILSLERQQDRVWKLEMRIAKEIEEKES